MTKLFDKYAPLQTRVDMMMKIGSDALGVQFDDILSATRGRIGNREILLAGTNNYLGLTFDEDCRAAAKKAVDDHGTGTTGSRVANGTYAEHTDLEKAMAEHFNMPSCIVFTTGYQTNLAAISGLAGDKDVIFMDADAHACIIDGSRLTNASTIRFRHNNPEDLDKRLRRQGEIEGGNALVVIEGMYSMFGDIAPVDEFLDVTHRHGGYLFIDEAHSYGVFGPTGCGIAEEQGVLDQVDFHAGLIALDYDLCADPSPVIAVRRPNEGVAAMEWNWLMENGVYVKLM